MAQNTAERQRRVASNLRRHIGERSTARFLQTLPAFKVVEEMPRHLKFLLEKLEAAEKGHTKVSR